MGQEILECYSYPGLKTWVETSGNLPNFEIHVLSAGRLFVVYLLSVFYVFRHRSVLWVRRSAEPDGPLPQPRRSAVRRPVRSNLVTCGGMRLFGV